MEILTNKGWSPANTLEAIIVSIRAQLIAGGARLDPHNKTEYTEAEAKDAFDRMVRDHGWH
jgi:ubiquitin-conjugating enzyme E2 Q